MRANQFAGMLRTLHRAQTQDTMDDEKRSMANIIRTAQIGNFDRESDAEGNPWSPRKSNYKHPPLRDTLAMYSAASDPYAPGSVEYMTHRRLVVGISDEIIPYAKYHQFGAGPIPKRQFFYMIETEREKLVAPMLTAMRRLLVQHGSAYGMSNVPLKSPDSTKTF